MSQRTSIPWTAEDDALLRELVLSHTHAEIGARLGRTRAAVRNHSSYLGLVKGSADYGAEELEIIRRHYMACKDGTLDLRALAKRLGRPRTSVSKQARLLGLTDQGRDRVAHLGGLTPSQIRRLPTHGTQGSPELRTALSDGARRRIREHGHPRGALGMKHTEESKRRIGEKTRAWNANRTPEQREAMRVKRNATNIERYGTANPAMLGVEQPYSRARGGRREDLDNRYFRSRWEANYMRYLLWLKGQGQIADVEYEPKTFVFQGVTRGVLTYTPDFKVTERDGSYCWHEVKGWMDPKSKAKLKRMAKFYPDEKIIVIGEDEYKAIAKWKALIPEWETTKND